MSEDSPVWCDPPGVVKSSCSPPVKSEKESYVDSQKGSYVYVQNTCAGPWEGDALRLWMTPKVADMMSLVPVVRGSCGSLSSYQLITMSYSYPWGWTDVVI